MSPRTAGRRPFGVWTTVRTAGPPARFQTKATIVDQIDEHTGMRGVRTERRERSEDPTTRTALGSVLCPRLCTGTTTVLATVAGWRPRSAGSGASDVNRNRPVKAGTTTSRAWALAATSPKP